MNSFERLMAMGETDQVKLVISRHWNSPQIKVTVNKDAIILEASIAAFANAVAAEVSAAGNPLWILSSAQLKARISDATLVAIEKIKQASSQVM